MEWLVLTVSRIEHTLQRINCITIFNHINHVNEESSSIAQQNVPEAGYVTVSKFSMLQIWAPNLKWDGLII